MDYDPLFVKDGVPIKFCFHQSVTQGRSQIKRDVERRGGKIVRDERLANVLLVDEQQDLEFLRRRYYSSTELYRLSLYVEPRGFVQACVRAGEYRHVEPVKKGMPGRAPGGGTRQRVPFTEEDRDHLAYYIATRCPTKDGRMGNNAYKDLERLGQTDDPSWAWARRHTFHSWREHYKMNAALMDARIDFYLARLKGVGHHLGHDQRRHDYRSLRQEEEDDEDEEEEERPGRERREQVRPAVAAARGYLARHEQDLVTFDDEGGGVHQQQQEEEEEVAVQEPQRVKRHAQHQRDVQKTQGKRARVSEASSNERRTSGVEAGRGESSPPREKDSVGDESQEIEGSDLFGDRTYGDESRFEFDDSQDIDFPMPFSPRASPVPERDDAPFSTQATLIASPLAAEKEHALAPAPTPTNVVEARVSTRKPTAPPSSQRTVVMTQERVVVQRARGASAQPGPSVPRETRTQGGVSAVHAPDGNTKPTAPPSSQQTVVMTQERVAVQRARGASAQPGPSVPRETRTQGGVSAVGAPDRNTRARSRSVDPQPQPEPKSQLARQREDQGGRGKGKAKDDVLVSIEEDARVEEGQGEAYAEEDVGSVPVTGGLSVRETFEDEMVVEGLLEASVGSVVDVEGGESVESVVDVEGEESVESVQDEDDGSSDGDVDSMPELPRFQEIEIGSEPSDSDDAETHGSLLRGAGGGESDQDQDEDDEDADADRIERMASGSLHVPVPTPPQPRVTRSMAATRTQTQTRTYPQISPRRTRSGNQARAGPLPTAFPSPGTKARAVVDRFQEEEEKVPYAPPAGSRAARAVRGGRRRG